MRPEPKRRLTQPPPIPGVAAAGSVDKTIATPPPSMGTMHAAGAVGSPIELEIDRAIAELALGDAPRQRFPRASSVDVQASELPESEGLKAGDIIDNKYEVVRVLGRGGMGLVLEAIHLQLREPVALKFMNAETVANPEAAARFTREARAAARLKGEHICRVLDMGETPAGDRYIVIEYLDGVDLSQLLRQRGPLPYPEVVDYVLQACEAMAEAHAAGIVHRDLKPANLFLTTGTDGTASIKVLDFGISKLLDPEISAVVTTTRSIMGSPLYMAPEQLVSAKDVDARTDIWALATVLYRLVTGRTPFYGESLPEVVAQVLHTDAPPMSAHVDDIPPALDRAIKKALAKKPGNRYATVADFAADLAAVLPSSSHRAARSAAVLSRPRRPSTAGGSNPPRPMAESDSSLSVVLKTIDEIPGEPLSSLEVSMEIEPAKRRSSLRHLRWAVPLLAIAAGAALYVSRGMGGADEAPVRRSAAPAATVDAPAPAPAPTPEPEPELVLDDSDAPTELPETDVEVERSKDRSRSRSRSRTKSSARSEARSESKTKANTKAKTTPTSGSSDLLEPGAVKAKKPVTKKPVRPKASTKPKTPAGPELLD